ncbi:MAG TPA: ACT domain-containing protein [bacterium]|nr:ACT domain-containing protein [bacterium]HPI75975.1 ACT domain-containing protein [bacterium]HPN93111.1 ACT domain-containing protein [bacterium]
MVKQISVFLENKYGRMAEATEAIGEAGVNIRALSVADTSDFGILRCIVNDTEKALKVLREKGFTASATPVVAAEAPDEPGGLARLLKIPRDNNVNVEYLYAFVTKSRDNAVVILRVDEYEKLISLLEKGGVKVLTEQEVVSL